jgi:cytochrome c peroxidase
MPRHTIAFVAALLAACSVPSELVVLPDDFPALPVPADNTLTAERVQLGKRLFYELRLSRTEDVSCGSCHVQEHAFADPRRFSVGVEGRTGERNSPPLFNLGWNTAFFWDGGAPTLEHQVIGPITNPLEMDMTMNEATKRLDSEPSYRALFDRAYGAPPSPGGITKAIASFMRTLVSGNSRYDRFQRGEADALSKIEQEGMELFFSERAECFHCHVGFNFTNNGFHNNGTAAEDVDLGRAMVTERALDEGKFKVPSLRNVAVTAPYMHDGSIATLDQVIEHYDRGGLGHPNTDPTIQPLGLSGAEKASLVAFLEALTDERFLDDPRFAPEPN